MQEVIDAVVSLVGNIFGAIGGWVNRIMGALVDGLLAVWPSTPPSIQLATLIRGVETSMPNAPWFLIGDLVRSAGVVLGVVVVWKAIKMVRG